MDQTRTTETLASTFARFANGLQFSQIPPVVREAALWHVVDSIGVCIAGAAQSEASGEAGRKLTENWGSENGATVLGLNARSRPELAALLNGAFGQALEMDDKHGSSLARPGSTVVPAALAVAEQRGAKIRDLITAVAVGYEIMIRLGFVAGDGFLERGYHTSSLLGAFGSAAAIGNLRRGSETVIVDALGIAGTMASGIQESTRTGSTSKILHGGWGAHAGILAMDLALAGISGPNTVFEGHYGFFRTHLYPMTDHLDWSKAVDSIGEIWHLQDTAYKPYPCCQLLHAFIEAAKQISQDLCVDRLSYESITHISCRLAEPGLTLVTEPKERKWAPFEPHEARFSLPFVVSTGFIFGDVGLESFGKQRLHDERILRLARLVETGEDPESDYPLHCPAVMEVEANGKIYRSRVRFHPGCPEAPLTKSQVIAKFARNTAWAFGEAGELLAKSLAESSTEETVRKMIGRLSVVQTAV